MATARNIHYAVALWSSLFIATSAVTGLLWAYAPYLYWEGAYKERKHTAPPPALQAAKVDFSAVIAACKERLPLQIPKEIGLKTDAGRLLYRVVFNGSPSGALLDAVSGEWISPLPELTAVTFARQYVPGEPAVESAEALSNWEDRKGQKYPLAWTVRFADASSTEITIDAFSGEVLEDSNSVRRFHFWVTKLHQFNFFGTHKVLTALSGVPLLLLLVSGLIIGIKRLLFAKRRFTQ